MKEIKEKKKDEYFDENMPNNDSLGESFRKSIHSNKNDDVKNNNKNVKKKSNYSNQKYAINKKDNEPPEGVCETEADSGFNYNGKKNTRSRMEIQEYIEKQKKKNKDKEEKNLKNNQAKKLNKY